MGADGTNVRLFVLVNRLDVLLEAVRSFEFLIAQAAAVERRGMRNFVLIKILGSGEGLVTCRAAVAGLLRSI